MLDAETKRRIDTARDILVGKVPDPKSQVEQITIALIYKFMDDIDAQSEALGGKRGFFAGEFAHYGWAKLMRGGLGGYDMLNRYAEAIAKMPENPGIPPLFRNIFNNAFLPYRDPETLRAFLKVIDEFDYDHSERLGDAFEYLLSVLGSQGDAGQFRTPRHIIDFMVALLDPKKDETVLDPACGTAGFLISSYKHILKTNTDDKGNSTLTPDDKEALAVNFKGYDISPDMVRLSLVNMYLHGFVAPQIHEYDTLTSEARWAERTDVILANPPFMSPKGGIRPHSRFSVQSKRSEVLFVDYIAEHLTANGRAGIIVPEGIIFQSQNAHKQLRKMLVDEYLVAVVSLPAGVFQPYSGVKTSILILDKSLARQTDHLAFFKVANDGFDLGAQRRPIPENDLPQVQAELAEYLHLLRTGKPVDTSQVAEQGIQYTTERGLIVGKERIAEGGEYNLIGERYREIKTGHTKYDWITLGEVILGKPQYGSGARKVLYDGKVRYVRITDISDQGELKAGDIVSPSTVEPDRFLEPGDLLIARSGSVGRTYIHKTLPGTYQYAGYLIRFRVNPAKAIPEYVYHVTKSDSWREWILSNSKTGTLTNINAKQYSSFQFPLPPLEVQREIVTEIEGYQKVIDGARAVVENYRPHIAVDPKRPVVALGEMCDIFNGSTPSRTEAMYWKDGTIPWFTVEDIRQNGRIVQKTIQHTTDKALKETSLKLLPSNSVLLCCTASVGEYAFAEIELTTNQQFNGLVVKESSIDRLSPKYLFYLSRQFKDELLRLSGKTSFNFVSVRTLKKMEVALPSLKTQQAIIAEIEAEQVLVDGNRELIERFEKKIRDAVGRVWGKER